ncbi:helix-turn-helix transcriptional regulator [Seohaeicola zhoushanensis]|uniref:Uncharacterized protein n=1 Tax=Seohaeicola zhoushanensis TaxID=1569283 RepID=A0A8J3H3J1_9RHOB|nr:hypothetical protein [Seohaeicola zhoushanensis]GHF72073.1 hypothetical protein GCM10017056_48850 [Seohaeicola zhoushanensis]
MIEKPLTRDDLVRFFGLKPVRTGDYRPLSRVLSALGIRLVGGTTRWVVVWSALGLSADQKPCHLKHLTEPLITAKSAAAALGVDPSIVYRWSKGLVPNGMPSFPDAIDLSNGRTDARALRWRRAEIVAWHSREPLPGYARTAPPFGSLTPRK